MGNKSKKPLVKITAKKVETIVKKADMHHTGFTFEENDRMKKVAEKEVSKLTRSDLDFMSDMMPRTSWGNTKIPGKDKDSGKTFMQYIMRATANKINELDDNLLTAVDENDLQKVKDLLLKGAKIQYREDRMDDPMQWARNYKMVCFLLKNGYPKDKYDKKIKYLQDSYKRALKTAAPEKIPGIYKNMKIDEKIFKISFNL